jgi:inhibitor of cysteine peptidase
VVIGNSYSPYRVPYPQENELSIMPPIYPDKHSTQVIIYDITDRSAPQKVRELELEGGYLTSRRIDSALYVISNQPTYRLRAEDDLLPLYRDSARGEQMHTVPLDQIAYFPDSIYSSYLLMPVL